MRSTQSFGTCATATLTRFARSIPGFRAASPGYNLDKLLPEADFHLAQALVGTEGTCVTVLAARCRLIPNPPARVLVVLAYPDIYAAGDDVPEILAHGPMGLEGLDDNILRAMELKDLHPRERTLLPGGGGWLLVEFGGGSQQEASDKTRELVEALRRQSHPPAFSLFENRNEQEMVWRVRRSALGASAQVPGEKETCEGWEDAAVPPDRVGPYLRDFRRLLDRYGYRSSTYGHFGDGCLHTRIDFDLKTKEGIAHFRFFWGIRGRSRAFLRSADSAVWCGVYCCEGLVIYPEIGKLLSLLGLDN